ncbi:hypothetical protein [Microvirga zambiensis]|uniref:hypothetical protein n=1 Tax=Microvirga zambiensis TaxID=1402137 RepID=UPI00191FCB29|nr:hypothetical protein [Microvirga zambiensis]
MTKAPRQSLKVQTPQEPRAVKDAGLPRNAMSPAETAQYVAEFSAELAFLARHAKLDLLAYLLDMARLEAIRVVQSSGKDG